MSGYRQGTRNMAAGLPGTGFTPTMSGNAMTGSHMNPGTVTGPRIMPEVSRLADFNVAQSPSSLTPQQTPNQNPQNMNQNPQNMNYDGSDLDEILRRQLNADISAYTHDLDWCNNCLTLPDLTPQETRTLTLRNLDTRHRIRGVSYHSSLAAGRMDMPNHVCQHQLEVLAHQKRTGESSMSNTARYGTNGQYPMSTPRSAGVKRQRSSKKLEGSDVSVSMLDAGDMTPSGEASPFTDNNQLQRLGFWKCRLCTSTKFLNAGSSRCPSAPCKWPLKDISKMLNHFLDLHTEHDPAERCMELGSALHQNRGPFEYWLTRTRSQDVDDQSVIDDYIDTLQSGNLPEPLRALNRAAAAFPNTVAGLGPKK